MNRRPVAGLFAAVVVAGATAGAESLPFALRLAGNWAAWCVIVPCLWSITSHGPHAVYYLRDGRGRTLYVGSASDRDSDGVTDFATRLLEHLGEIETSTWKGDIAPHNCTVARRCATRRGMLSSERRRIVALTAASRLRLAPPLRNVVHARGRRLPLAAVTWYAVESRFVPAARWHRPLVLPAPGSTAARVFDADGVSHDAWAEGELEAIADARAERDRSARAARGNPRCGSEAPRGLLDGVDVDAEWAGMVDGLDAWWDEAHPRDLGRGAAGTPEGGPGWDMGHGTRDVGTSGHGFDHACWPCEGREAVENGATTDREGDMGPQVPAPGGEAHSGTSGEVGHARPCSAEGCPEPASRGTRCGTHHRAWEAERKRARRRKEGQ